MFLNPRLPREVRERFEAFHAAAPSFEDHSWIATSGSSGILKLAGLSKEALRASALAVNQHLESSASDRWLLALPPFHVGGLAILERARVSNAQVIRFSEDERWNPRKFCDTAQRERATLSSLVPTQVFDLVKERLTAPPSLRAVVVGGGVLSEELYTRARELRWPLLPSYGLTECGSQVATASMSSLQAHAFPQLNLLEHIVARVSSDERFEFSGESLFSGYLLEGEGGALFVDPKERGWFCTDDCGELRERELMFKHRVGDVVKVGGEKVDVAYLNRLLRDMMLEIEFQGDAAIVTEPDDRLGARIKLIITSHDAALQLEEKFNSRVLPFERIRVAEHVPTLPRTPLGKLLPS